MTYSALEDTSKVPEENLLDKFLSLLVLAGAIIKMVLGSDDEDDDD